MLASIICCMFQFLLVAFELRFTANRHTGWRTWTKQAWHAVDHVGPALDLDECRANLEFDWCPICGAWPEPRELPTCYQRAWQNKREHLTEAIQSPKHRFVPGKQKATTDELERKQQHIFQTRSKDGALSRYKELVADGVGRLLPTRASDNNTQSSGPTPEPKP